MSPLRELLLIVAGILAINVAIATVLWTRHRTPLHRAQLAAWIASMLSMILQGIVQSERWMPFAFGAGSFLVDLMLADLLRRALDLTISWRALLQAFAFCLLVATLGTLLGAPFWMRALPFAIASTLPLAELLYRSLHLPRGTLSATAVCALGAVAIYGLHVLDYPFLRTNAAFAPTGFVLAILSAFSLSITAPAIVIERNAKEVARLEAKIAAREDLAALGEAAAVVAHEVRNPLAVIVNAVHLLRREPTLSPQGEALLGMQEQEVLRLERLVQDLLGFTRLAEPTVKEVQLGDLLRNTAHTLALLADAAKVRLEVPLDADTRLIRGDADHLQRALTNLVKNAIEASPPSGTVSVSIGDATDGFVRLVVRDQGPGVPQENQRKVFQPFFTTRASGTGLGLAIASRVMKAHGGTVTVTNIPSGGAEFGLVFPASPSS